MQKYLRQYVKGFHKQKHQLPAFVANEWDAVIITHDMFIAIRNRLSLKKKYLNRDFNNLEDDLKVVSENRSLGKRVLKGLESRQRNLNVETRDGKCRH